MYETEVTVAVLNQNEALLGYLHPNYVDIIETNELGGLRSIEINHPLIDTDGCTLDKYDTLLTAGNKIWRPSTCDGVPCLYVLLGEKEYDFKNNTVHTYAEEISMELGQYKIWRSSAFNWSINSTTALNNIVGDLFTAGTVSGPTTATAFNGSLTTLSILRAIEARTGGEFEFTYSINPNGTIKRTINWLNGVGETINMPIEIGYNTDDIQVKINESEVSIAAAPLGEPQNDSALFHKQRKAFEDQAFSTSTQIPLYVTKDDEGNDVNGPMAYPPYPKSSGSKYVVSNVQGELIAAYQTIKSKSPNQANTFPRIWTFDSSEENKYNLYWECVTHIREHLHPEISISCNIIDIQRLRGLGSQKFNVGDTVKVRLPGRETLVTARILKTTKNPRNPESDSIEIGNYSTKFTKQFFKNFFKVSGEITL